MYDPALRPVRDLLQRRMSLVRQHTALLLSFKGLYARTTGQALPLLTVKKMEPEESKSALRASGQLSDCFVTEGTH